MKWLVHAVFESMWEPASHLSYALDVFSLVFILPRAVFFPMGGVILGYIQIDLNAKIIQPACCNAFCKGACGTLHKWLCWEFGVSTIVFVFL